MKGKINYLTIGDGGLKMEARTGSDALAKKVERWIKSRDGQAAVSRASEASRKAIEKLEKGERINREILHRPFTI